MLGFEGNENTSVTLRSCKLTLLSPSSQQAQRWTHHAWARSQNKVRAAARPQPRPVLPGAIIITVTQYPSAVHGFGEEEEQLLRCICIFRIQSATPVPCSRGKSSQQAVFVKKFYWDPLTLIPACVPMTLFTRDARVSSHNRDPGTCEAENIPSPVLYRRSLQTPKQLAGKEVLKQI